MSASFSCKCSERRLPATQRAWVVTQRNCNHSAFNGYRTTYSEYSTVICEACRACGRTKAAFVRDLPDAPGYYEQARFHADLRDFDPAAFDAGMAEFLRDLRERGKGLVSHSISSSLQFAEISLREVFKPRSIHIVRTEVESSIGWIRQNPDLFNVRTREFVNRAHTDGWHVRTSSRAGFITFIAAEKPEDLEPRA